MRSAMTTDTEVKPQTRSVEDIQALKKSWVDDPCWDIEDTDGFEAHYDELKAYHLEMKAKWDAEYEAKKQKENESLQKEFDELGILGLFKLVKNLKDRVTDLESENSDLKHQISRLKN